MTYACIKKYNGYMQEVPTTTYTLIIKVMKVSCRRGRSRGRDFMAHVCIILLCGQKMCAYIDT